MFLGTSRSEKMWLLKTSYQYSFCEHYFSIFLEILYSELCRNELCDKFVVLVMAVLDQFIKCESCTFFVVFSVESVNNGAEGNTG